MNQVFREAEAVKPQPYPIGPGHSAPWVVHPSVSTPALVSPASIYINYRSAPGPAGTYPVTYSYADALMGRLPPDAVRGKAVVVDSVAAVFSVPTSATQDETWGRVDAQVLEEILDNAYLVPVPGALETPVLLIADILIALVVGILTLARAVPLSLLLVVGYGALALLAYRAGGLADVVVIPLSLVATPVAVGGYRFVRETLERRRIYDLFGRYVLRTVVAELVRRPAELATELGGTKRDVTVLFADIRGFTAWSAELPPDQVIGRLNELLSALVGVAFEREGTVDKYIGDAVMVIWNAPINQPDHVQRAVQAGLEMARRVRHQQLGVGIGIHCGEAVVGNVGTVERLEYTAIGSTVNMAARLCESAARGEVVISEAVRDRLAEGVELEPRAELHAKGIAAPLRTYRVIAASANDPAAAVARPSSK
jgi:class 3 adenylate cyclase